MLESRINVVDSRMKDIDRSDKNVILHYELLSLTETEANQSTDINLNPETYHHTKWSKQPKS